MATSPLIGPRAQPAALQGVFREASQLTPQNATRFNRPGLWAELAQTLSRPSHRRFLIGFTLLTGGAGLLLYGAYQGLRGRLQRQVRPDLAGEINENAADFLRTGVGKSEWKAISTLARSGRDQHARQVKDAVIRSNALKLIGLRPEARALKPTLDQCSTGQLTRLARLVVKERVVTEEVELPDGKKKEKDPFPLSGQIFSQLRGIQVEQQARSSLLDQHTIEALRASDDDSVADQVSFHEPAAVQAQAAPALGDALQAQAGRPEGQDPVARQKMLRAFAADLLAPASIGNGLKPGRLADTCVRHREALEIVKQDRDGAVAAGVPPVIIDVLASADVDQLAGDPGALEARLGQAVDQAAAQFDFKPFSGRLQAVTRDLALPDSMRNFLQDVFGEYFGAQTLADRKAMMASLLRGSLESSDTDRQLVELLKGSGPFMQKIMQMVCEQIKDPETRTVLSEVKSRLNPIDRDTKKALLAQIVRDFNGAIQSMADVRTLGAASVGEALLARAVTGDPPTEKEIVIKLLRPGVGERAARENSIISEIASRHQGMLLTFSGMADQITDEMNLAREADNVGLAQVYAGQAEGLSVMRLAGIGRAHPSYMLCERAPGKNLADVMSLLERVSQSDDASERIEGIDPEAGMVAQGSRAQSRARRALEIGVALEQRMAEVQKVWLTEALLGSGFFHGDLHAGNIMYGVDQDQMTLIDMGNARVASHHERRALARMLVAIDRGHPRLYQEAIAGLLAPESRVQAEAALADPEMQSHMRLQFAEFGSDVPRAFSKLLDVYANFGIEIPAFVTNFGRSMIMLKDTAGRLKEINERNYLRSQPGFAQSERRYQSLSTEITRVQSDIKAATRSTRAAMTATLSDSGTDPASEEGKRLIEEEVVRVTAGASAELVSFEAELAALRTELFSGLPSVDDDKVVVRALTDRKWPFMKLLGPGFASRLTTGAVGSYEAERAAWEVANPGLVAMDQRFRSLNDVLKSEP